MRLFNNGFVRAVSEWLWDKAHPKTKTYTSPIKHYYKFETKNLSTNKRGELVASKTQPKNKSSKSKGRKA